MEITTRKGNKARVTYLGEDSYEVTVVQDGEEKRCHGNYRRKEDGIIFILGDRRACIQLRNADRAQLKAEYEAKFNDVFCFENRVSYKIGLEKAKETERLVMYDWKMVESRSGDLADDMKYLYVDSDGRIYSKMVYSDIA